MLISYATLFDTNVNKICKRFDYVYGHKKRLPMMTVFSK